MHWVLGTSDVCIRNKICFDVLFAISSTYDRSLFIIGLALFVTRHHTLNTTNCLDMSLGLSYWCKEIKIFFSKIKTEHYYCFFNVWKVI